MREQEAGLALSETICLELLALTRVGRFPLAASPGTQKPLKSELLPNQPSKALIGRLEKWTSRLPPPLLTTCGLGRRALFRPVLSLASLAEGPAGGPGLADSGRKADRSVSELGPGLLAKAP